MKRLLFITVIVFMALAGSALAAIPLSVVAKKGRGQAKSMCYKVQASSVGHYECAPGSWMQTRADRDQGNVDWGYADAVFIVVEYIGKQCKYYTYTATIPYHFENGHVVQRGSFHWRRMASGR